MRNDMTTTSEIEGLREMVSPRGSAVFTSAYFLCMCVHVHIYTCVFACMCWPKNRLLCMSGPSFLETGPLSSLEFAKQARLVSHRTKRLHVALPSQCWHYWHVPPCPDAFTWILRSASGPCETNTLPSYPHECRIFCVFNILPFFSLQFLDTSVNLGAF